MRCIADYSSSLRRLLWSPLAFALVLRLTVTWAWPYVHQPGEVFRV